MSQNKSTKTNQPITRSVSTSSVYGDGNNNKRPRDDMQIDDDPNCDLLSKIQQMFSISNAKIEAKIDASNAKLEDKIVEVENMLFALKAECTSSISSISTAVTEVRDELISTVRRLDRLEKASDLIISGIPYATNENLMDSFFKFAAVLGYNEVDRPIVDLKRLQRFPIPVGTTPPIVCQFAMKNARDSFYGRYLRTRNLSLRHLGFDNDRRVFFNENLTQHDRDIRTTAIKLKKNGALKNVFTRDGIVFVQRLNGSNAEPVVDIKQLAVHKSSNLSK